MKEIFLHKEDIPTRCDSCPFSITRQNDKDTAKLDYICLARDSRIPMATLYYTDSMYWKDKKCPIKSIDGENE